MYRKRKPSVPKTWYIFVISILIIQTILNPYGHHKVELGNYQEGDKLKNIHPCSSFHGEGGLGNVLAASSFSMVTNFQSMYTNGNKKNCPLE